MARPRKKESEKYRSPARQLGRVPDDDWKVIQQGYKLSGADSFTQFATDLLLGKSKRLIKAQKRKS